MSTFRTTRSACFTLNNPDEDDNKVLASLSVNKPDKLKRIIYQLEKSSTGTPHYQGYAEFTESLSKSAIKTLLGSDKLHLEKRLGTVDQAVRYCQKKDTQLQPPVKVGDFSDTKTKTPKKMTLDEVYAQFIAGKRLYDIQEMSPGYYFKNQAVIFKMYNAVKQQSKKFKAKVVVVLYGQTGVGKTRYFNDTYSAKDSFMLTKSSSNQNLWLDGYMDQKYVCIDEFYGWIPLNTMLGMLDGWPMQLECKGGFCWFSPEIIYITSNSKPKNWYHWSSIPDGDIKQAALMRRITHCIEVPDSLPYSYLKTKLDAYIAMPTATRRITYNIHDQLQTDAIPDTDQLESETVEPSEASQ